MPVQRRSAPGNRKRAAASLLTREERIDLRASAAQKSFIKQAADIDHKKLSVFMLESALKAASEILTERRIFNLNAAQWAEFNTILDRPVVYKPNLAKLVNEKGIFD